MSSTYTCKHGSTEMLTPRNYHTWKADIMVFLTCENALEIVLGNEDPPPANASFAMRESYKKRLGLATGMFTHPSNPVFVQISTNFLIVILPKSGLHLESSSTQPHPALVVFFFFFFCLFITRMRPR